MQYPTLTDFFLLKTNVYEPNGFVLTDFKMDAESLDYAACSFQLNGKFVRFRTAKITPTKIGQFVTLWKRKEKGPIQPFDISDEVDFVIVSARMKDHFGQFIFPKSVLAERGIFSKNEKGGKRAIRVYPPWDKTVSKQAQQSQRWQLEYFADLSNGLFVKNHLDKY